MVFVELRVEANRRVWVIGFALQESALAWCYLVVRHGVRCRLTSKLTDRRYLTHKTSQTPRNVPKAQTAVRCSALRQSKVHHLKISGPTLSEKRADGPSGYCARNISDVPTKHTKTNPQRPGECAWSLKPTGGNRVNRGSIPLRCLPGLLFKISGVARLRRTQRSATGASR